MEVAIYLLAFLSVLNTGFGIWLVILWLTGRVRL
jgi:hypothetical protein